MVQYTKMSTLLDKMNVCRNPRRASMAFHALQIHSCRDAASALPSLEKALMKIKGSSECLVGGCSGGGGGELVETLSTTLV